MGHSADDAVHKIPHKIKKKPIGRISWNFRYYFDLQSFIEFDIKKIDVTLVQYTFKQLLTKYQTFPKLPQIPHIHINRHFSVYLQLFRPTASFL